MTAGFSSMTQGVGRPSLHWRLTRMWLTAWRHTRVCQCSPRQALSPLCACGRQRGRRPPLTWPKKLLPTRCAGNKTFLWSRGARFGSFLHDMAELSWDFALVHRVAVLTISGSYPASRHVTAIYVGEDVLSRGRWETPMASALCECVGTGAHAGWTELWCAAQPTAVGGHHPEPGAAAGHHVAHARRRPFRGSRQCWCR